MFLSALTDPEGVLVVKSRKLDGSSLVKLDTYRDDSRVYSEVSMAGPLTTDVFNGHRAVTAAIAPGVLVHHVWGVDQATGEITLLGELVQGGTRDQVEITPFSVNTTSPGELFPPVYYATGFRSIGAAAWGAALPQTTSVSPPGDGRRDDGRPRAGWGGGARRARCTAERGRLDQPGPDLTAHGGRRRVARSRQGVLDARRGGDYVPAVTDPLTDELRLRAYRSGDRPY
jgi:hypothetical protein